MIVYLMIEVSVQVPASSLSPPPPPSLSAGSRRKNIAKGEIQSSRQYSTNHAPHGYSSPSSRSHRLGYSYCYVVRHRRQISLLGID